MILLQLIDCFVVGKKASYLHPSGFSYFYWSKGVDSLFIHKSIHPFTTVHRVNTSAKKVANLFEIGCKQSASCCFFPSQLHFFFCCDEILSEY